MAVVTAVTAQNSWGIQGIYPVPEKVVDVQLESILKDIGVEGIKIGMLGTAAIIRVVEQSLLKHQPRYTILDPVFHASDGTALLDSYAVDVLRARLLPLVDVITPNLAEASRLTGMSVSTIEEMRHAADCIYQMGVGAVLIKGGHLSGNKKIDVLFNGENYQEIVADTVIPEDVHGTGCTLSAAITARLSRNIPLLEAVKGAKAYVTTAMLHALRVGSGYQYLDHMHDLSSPM